MSWRARCPHCGSTDLELHETRCEASSRDESFSSTHRCRNEKCGRAFRVTPPTLSTIREVAT